MKLITVMFTLCSMTVVAADAFDQRSDTNGNRRGSGYYTGNGTMIPANARDQRIRYKIIMNTKALEPDKLLLKRRFTVDGKTTIRPLVIAKESDAFQKVLVPASDDKLKDYASYVETGWALESEYDELQEEEGTAKKRTLLFNYLDTDGNRITEHILAYRKDGKWQATFVGTLSDTDGKLLYVWRDRVSEHVVRAYDSP